MLSPPVFCVIDWQGFRIGPRFLDIVKYAVHAKTSYTVLKDLYLFNETSGGLSTIEQIFFLDAYVLMVLLTSMRKPLLTTGLAANIDPALTDMRKCVARLKDDGFSSALRSVADRVERLDNQLSEQTAQNRQRSHDLDELATRAAELNQERESLVSTNRCLERRLHQLEHSTTWRLTRPLRRIARVSKRVARAARTRAEICRPTRR